MTRTKCSVCNDSESTQFLYQVDCCNACAMAHRRHCEGNEDPKTYFGDQNCNFCCFKKYRCIEKSKNISIDLAGLLKDLSIREFHRNIVFTTKSVRTNFTVDDAVSSEKLKLINCPLGSHSTFEDWSTMNQIATIDYLKNLEFVKELGDEKTKFIRRIRFRSAILSTAFRSYQQNKDSMDITDNVDIP
ncbi:hypothetical protein GCK72_009869 [Caenorhabditis remanei]|uniref:Uncharacterized protein n=1 Tax=Caenorhabditis remanei TaxID=31234 RepID=A0A6A5H523_CAERE|nr:hypothetical protein GCK72_009869 [Caenorhabditis remanei]KAF1761613.1 hypothetical protein GCK72_009869 [Caenorhabditis remanei]